jgi:hypothetical protein
VRRREREDEKGRRGENEKVRREEGRMQRGRRGEVERDKVRR